MEVFLNMECPKCKTQYGATTNNWKVKCPKCNYVVEVEKEDIKAIMEFLEKTKRPRN